MQSKVEVDVHNITVALHVLYIYIEVIDFCELSFKYYNIKSAGCHSDTVTYVVVQ